MSDHTASLIGILTVLVLSLVLAFLLGCDAPAPVDHTAPDLGDCVGLSATLTDAGPVANVYAFPEGYPCGDGGMCRLGRCEP